ncbi:hypothetical protein DWX10_13990 [Clostridium sp. AF18-27]|nr:hypothetical protein DWX10_13990 [Clostridium sp. AF18-27]
MGFRGGNATFGLELLPGQECRRGLEPLPGRKYGAGFGVAAGTEMRLLVWSRCRGRNAGAGLKPLPGKGMQGVGLETSLDGKIYRF